MNDSKINYKLLICDDNIHYIERLVPEISKINYKNKDYHIDIDVSSSPEECLNFLKNSIYDIVILDVCIRGSQKPLLNSDLLRYNLQSEYYGPELYTEVLRFSPDAKIFVLSNLRIDSLRTIFNNAEVEYFNKKSTSEGDVARHVKNYFETGKKRIYNNVFVVYGHNEEMYMSVNRFVKNMGLNSIDLMEQSSGGLSFIFDALLDCAPHVDCAIVLLSADDKMLDEKGEISYRARQNVIFEMGFFAGYLGKNKVIAIYEKNDNFEFPSDIQGVYWVEYSHCGEWQDKLNKYLNKVGFDFN